MVFPQKQGFTEKKRLNEIERCCGRAMKVTVLGKEHIFTCNCGRIVRKDRHRCCGNFMKKTEIDKTNKDGASLKYNYRCLQCGRWYEGGKR